MKGLVNMKFYWWTLQSSLTNGRYNDIIKFEKTGNKISNEMTNKNDDENKP